MKETSTSCTVLEMSNGSDWSEHDTPVRLDEVRPDTTLARLD